eukprot:gene43320-57655_t
MARTKKAGQTWQRNDNGTSTIRGHACVIGTCDAAREREATKELTNLLLQALEECPNLESSKPSDDATSKDMSIQGILALELENLKKINKESSQAVVSINTGMKGVILIKIQRQDICPVQIVHSIFDRVKREKLPCSRHIIRLIPLQKVCYPNDEELTTTVLSFINDQITNKAADFIQTTSSQSAEEDALEPIPKKLCTRDEEDETVTSSESMIGSDATTTTLNPVLPTTSSEEKSYTNDDISDVPAVPETNLNPTPPPISISSSTPLATPVSSSSLSLSYSVIFKRRNHNIIHRTQVQNLINRSMPPWARINYTKPQ